MEKIEVGLCKNCKYWEGESYTFVGSCQAMATHYDVDDELFISEEGSLTPCIHLCYGADSLDGELHAHLKEKAKEDILTASIYTSRYFGCRMFEAKQQTEND